MDFTKLIPLVPLFQRLDPETVQLFITFSNKAMASGDPNGFVKQAMRKAIAEQSGPTVVQAEFEKP